MTTVISVNTGEILAEGPWEEVRDIVNRYKLVPNKHLYINYGFTDNNINHLWVIDEPEKNIDNLQENY